MGTLLIALAYSAWGAWAGNHERLCLVKSHGSADCYSAHPTQFILTPSTESLIYWETKAQETTPSAWLAQVDQCLADFCGCQLYSAESPDMTEKVQLLFYHALLDYSTRHPLDSIGIDQCPEKLPTGHFVWGQYHLQKETRPQSAEATLEMAYWLDNNWQYPQSRGVNAYEIGRLFTKREEIALAKGAFQRVVGEGDAIAPRYRQLASIELAQIAWKNQEIAEAIRATEQGLAVAPDSADEYIPAYLRLLKSAEIDLITHLTRYFQDNPTISAPFIRALLADNQRPVATTIVGQLVQNDPDNHGWIDLQKLIDSAESLPTEATPW